MEHRHLDPRDDQDFVIPTYDVPEIAKPFVIAEANRALLSSAAARAVLGKPSSVVYTLRVDVTVPLVDGKPDYSGVEIVNRVDAALQHVPGDCDVRLQEYSTVAE